MKSPLPLLLIGLAVAGLSWLAARVRVIARPQRRCSDRGSSRVPAIRDDASGDRCRRIRVARAARRFTERLPCPVWRREKCRGGYRRAGVQWHSTAPEAILSRRG